VIVLYRKTQALTRLCLFVKPLTVQSCIATVTCHQVYTAKTCVSLSLHTGEQTQRWY